MSGRKISILDIAAAITGDEKIPVSIGTGPDDNIALTPALLMEYISDALGLENAIIHCGDYNATLQLFPNLGGTGSGGTVKKNNEFDIIIGSLDPFTVPVGCTIRAKKNLPSISDPADWRIFY